MQAIIKGNAALCVHQEQLSYEVTKGKQRVTTTHLCTGFLVLTGPAAGVSGNLPDN